MELKGRVFNLSSYNYSIVYEISLTGERHTDVLIGAMSMHEAFGWQAREHPEISIISIERIS